MVLPVHTSVFTKLCKLLKTIFDNTSSDNKGEKNKDSIPSIFIIIALGIILFLFFKHGFHHRI
jgi:hypothetical protein